MSNIWRGLGCPDSFCKFWARRGRRRRFAKWVTLLFGISMAVSAFCFGYYMKPMEDMNKLWLFSVFLIGFSGAFIIVYAILLFLIDDLPRLPRLYLRMGRHYIDGREVVEDNADPPANPRDFVWDFEYGELANVTPEQELPDDDRSSRFASAFAFHETLQRNLIKSEEEQETLPSVSVTESNNGERSS